MLNSAPGVCLEPRSLANKRVSPALPFSCSRSSSFRTTLLLPRRQDTSAHTRPSYRWDIPPQRLVLHTIADHISELPRRVSAVIPNAQSSWRVLYRAYI